MGGAARPPSPPSAGLCPAPERHSCDTRTTVTPDRSAAHRRSHHHGGVFPSIHAPHHRHGSPTKHTFANRQSLLTTSCARQSPAYTSARVMGIGAHSTSSLPSTSFSTSLRRRGCLWRAIQPQPAQLQQREWYQMKEQHFFCTTNTCTCVQCPGLSLKKQ